MQQTRIFSLPVSSANAYRQYCRCTSKQQHLCAPASCFEELQRNATVVGRGKGVSDIQIQVAIDNLSRRVEPVEMQVLAPFEPAARLRIERRDPTDWPVIALAMATGFPIWTQDQDFFGCGIATWTTDRVEIYLQQP